MLKREVILDKIIVQFVIGFFHDAIIKRVIPWMNHTLLSSPLSYLFSFLSSFNRFNSRCPPSVNWSFRFNWFVDGFFVHRRRGPFEHVRTVLSSFWFAIFRNTIIRTIWPKIVRFDSIIEFSKQCLRRINSKVTVYLKVSGCARLVVSRMKNT